MRIPRKRALHRVTTRNQSQLEQMVGPPSPSQRLNSPWLLPKQQMGLLALIHLTSAQLGICLTSFSFRVSPASS